MQYQKSDNSYIHKIGDEYNFDVITCRFEHLLQNKNKFTYNHYHSAIMWGLTSGANGTMPIKITLPAINFLSTQLAFMGENIITTYEKVVIY